MVRRVYLHIALIAAIFSLCINGFAIAGTVPPSQTSHFYGDADGDLTISGLDIIQHKNFVAANPYTYDTIQPADPSTDWNTCDIDSDRTCSGLDLIVLKNVIAGNSNSIGDDSWVISNPVVGGLPAIVEPSSVTAFRINVSSNNGTSGRPGISVLAIITSGGGSLGGRPCNPNPAEGRDQVIVGGSFCALSVTQTDWPVSTTDGLTETGSTGFTFNAPPVSGPVEFIFVILGNPALDMPTVEYPFSVNVTWGNSPPTITSTCSPTASEGVAYSCALTATDPDIPPQTLTWSKTASDTCGGSIVGTNYIWTPGETQGGGVCVIGLQVTDDGSHPMSAILETSVTVAETNQPPAITSMCPDTASEGVVYTCNLSATDADIPAQTLTFSKGTSDTCSGTISSSTYTAYTPESSGGGTCVVSIKVTDSYSPSASSTQNTTVSVTETNQIPSINTDYCSSTVYENEQLRCVLGAYDADTPSQTITWGKTGADTCGGSFSNPTGKRTLYNFTPTEAQGGTTCIIGVQVQDNWSPPATRTKQVNLNIYEKNRPPIASLSCTGADSASSGTCTPSVSDPDSPSEILDCALVSATCVNMPVIGDCSTFTVPPQGLIPFCTIEIWAFDNYTSHSEPVKAYYYISDYSTPYFVDPPAPNEVAFTSHYDGIGMDNDLPNTSPGDPGYLTCSVTSTDCGFPVNYTGSGNGVVSCVLSMTDPGWSTVSCSATLRITDGTGQYAEATIGINRLPDSWTWVEGTTSDNYPGIYISKGVPDPDNMPGGRAASVSWTDADGNFWLFGGYGYGNTTTAGYLNDLWKWDGTYWTWVGGSNTTNQYGNYGTIGITDPMNFPGARSDAAIWVDELTGNVWLFGGYGYAAPGFGGYLNDLWKWDGTNWTWVTGSFLGGDYAVYGTKGVPSPDNVPGARYRSALWVDFAGNVWLFGGYYVYTSDDHRNYNDLWKWDGTNWTWISGSSTPNAIGSYGVQGVPAATNVPGARTNVTPWMDASGNLWFFGGEYYQLELEWVCDWGWIYCDYFYNDYYENYNDIWKWDGTNWTWMKGSNLPDQPGTYGTKGIIAPTNTPGARSANVSWMDSSDNIWMFGGDYDSCTEAIVCEDYCDPWGYCFQICHTDRTCWTEKHDDLWKWDGVNWTWMNGSNLTNQPGNYGTMGVPASTNIPSGRRESTSWVDQNDQLWLFGGNTYLNDLWMYNP